MDYDKVERIVKFCKGKIGFSFGIGTDFTNDVGLERMNIVIKMTDALPEDGDWIPVIKLSDEAMKHTGDPQELEMAMRYLQIDEHA